MNMRVEIKAAIAALGTSLAMISTTVAQETVRPQSGSSFEITPYLWAAGTDADVTVGGRTVAVERDFSDIVENVDVGGDLLTIARFGRFVLYGQLDFLSLNTGELDNGPTRGELDIDFQATTVAMGVQLNGRKPGQTYDLLFGAREVSIEPELTLNTIGTFRGERELTDPLIMFRPTTPFGKRWKFNSTFSYGEGDSKKTYEMWPQFQLQINDKVAARFGYRRLFYDIEQENTLNAWDGSLQGVTIGIGGTFGGPRPVPAAAAPPPAPTPPPPPPAAPPPPPPPDTDRDGVVDARDQCADTRAGERVDAIGCSFEMRLNVLFAHDSATLETQSTADLDRVVELLTRVQTLSGVIEGHSDSTGAAQYNQSLSERRAQAVMAYLVQRGVNQSRLRAAGFGESQPIADNGTDAGRAENRRVVLRRSDSPR
jgi:outer membrane protein OmpA-like peptidoglycan-associated protein